MSLSVLLPVVVAVAALITVVVTRLSKTLPPCLPPGPRAFPIIGNVLELSVRTPWTTFSKWANIHGPIVYASFFGAPCIIITSAELASNILDRKSFTSSARPPMTMASLSGYENLLPLLQHTTRFKSTRRYLHQTLNAEAITQYSQDHERNACVFVLRLIDSKGDDILKEVRRCVAVGIGKVTYGTEISKTTSHFVELGEEALKVFGIVTTPFYWLVDAIPRLRFIPATFPGMEFKRRAQYWKAGTVQRIVDSPFEHVLQAIRMGTSPRCLVSQLLANGLEEQKKEVDYMDTLKWAASAAYLGGTETSVSVLASFILAMVMYPNSQKRAQSEIDDLTKGRRLPSFSDRSALPYLDCIFKEILRWQPPAPLVFPHIIEKQESVGSMNIPQGSTIIVNLWGMFKDESVYSDPDTFNPERFMDPSVPSPLGPSFGYGRRVCPGFHLANRSIWITMATTLALLDLSSPDAPCIPQSSGHQPRYSDGPMRHPLSFECDIKIRNDALVDGLKDL